MIIVYLIIGSLFPNLLETLFNTAKTWCWRGCVHKQKCMCRCYWQPPHCRKLHIAGCIQYIHLYVCETRQNGNEKGRVRDGEIGRRTTKTGQQLFLISFQHESSSMKNEFRSIFISSLQEQHLLSHDLILRCSCTNKVSESNTIYKPLSERSKTETLFNFRADVLVHFDWWKREFENCFRFSSKWKHDIRLKGLLVNTEYHEFEWKMDTFAWVAHSNQDWMRSGSNIKIWISTSAANSCCGNGESVNSKHSWFGV